MPIVCSWQLVRGFQLVSSPLLFNKFDLVGGN